VIIATGRSIFRRK